MVAAGNRVVTVFGGTGFLGRRIVRYLRQNGFYVRVASRQLDRADVSINPDDPQVRWEQVPRYLIRDRDACYGSIFVRRVRSLGIRDHPTSARSPWQNGYAERLSVQSGGNVWTTLW
jgi:hypothetical protein